MTPDDLSRRSAPRNGIGLSKQAAENVRFTVDDIVMRIEYAIQQLEVARVRAGNSAWRDECWTPAQRKALRVAKRQFRKESRRWRKRK